MPVRQIRPGDRAEWLRMRRTLWPECSEERHALEIEEHIERPAANVVFVFERADGGLGGFVEASIRDHVDGSLTPRVGYIEGWYVDPDLRRQGIGRQLIEAAEHWTAAQGLTEMGSDCDLENLLSQHAHKALGFRVTFRLVHYLKPIRREGHEFN